MSETIRSVMLPLSARSVKLSLLYGAEILSVHGNQRGACRMFYRAEVTTKMEDRVFCIYTTNSIVNTIRGTYIGSVTGFNNSWHIYEEHNERP